MPWRKLEDMYASVDNLESGPTWTGNTLNVKTAEGEETFVVYRRCPLEIVRHLIGLERLRDHMRFGPEREWTTTIDGRRIRVYSEMWTGDWWWRLQVGSIRIS